LLASDQLSLSLPGNWFAALGIAVLALAVLSVFVLMRLAWRRNREQLRGHALLFLAGGAGAALIGIVAIIGLVENAQVTSIISGADVRLTKPVIESLPRPPGTKILDETPGIAGTESISEDLAPPDLKTVVPFYERELSKLGWIEDKTSAATPIVRFTKGDFIISVATDPPSGDYTLTVDHLTPEASGSPSPGTSASPGASSEASPSAG
jgi:hypothetical protein